MSNPITIDKCDIELQYFDRKKQYVERKTQRNNSKFVISQSKDGYEVRISSNHYNDYFISENLQISSISPDSNGLSIKLTEYNCKMCITNFIQDNFQSIIEILNKKLVKIVKPSKFVLAKTINDENIDINILAKTMQQNHEIIGKMKPGLLLVSSNYTSPNKKKMKQNGSSPTHLTSSRLVSSKSEQRIASKQQIQDMSIEQIRTIKYVQQGYNVFISGGAGTGKSTLLFKLIQELQTMYGQEFVYITATSGLAASAVGGTTVHQFCGLGVVNDEDDADEIIHQVIRCPQFVFSIILI